MTGKADENPYMHFNLRQLMTRRVMCRWIIDKLKKWQAEGEDASEGLAQYRGDMKQINAAIREKKWDGKPPDQSVGMEVVQMNGKALKR